MSDLKNKLLEKIEGNEVKMRSRSFFVFTKALVEVVLIALIVLVVYLMNLSFYLPKRGLGLSKGGFRWNLLLDIIPWHYLLLGVLGLGVAFWMLYRFTGTYKKHFLITIISISLGVIILSAFLAFSNFNEHIQERKPLRGLYMMDGQGSGYRNGGAAGPRQLK